MSVRRVLVVEADIRVGQLVALGLQDVCDVMLATADEAVEILEDDGADITLIDLDTDPGWEFLRVIRDQDGHADTYVVAMAGTEKWETFSTLCSFGEDIIFLAKPFGLLELRDTVCF